jgi:exodeoxyribonuclease V alpha subunit
VKEIAAELAARDLPPEAAHLAVEVASWPRDAAPGERRALALLVAALLEARAAGSTRLELGAAPPAVAPLAEALRAGRPPDALAALFGRPGDYRPFIVDGDHLYAERELRLEQRLGAALAARLAHPNLSVRDRAALEAVLAEAGSARDGGGRPLTDEQGAALAAALHRPLTVVSGGPGTGKTALAVAIVRALARVGFAPHEVALAAPTGKAANRLAESLQAALGPSAAGAPAPQTLHRLLGYRGRMRRAGVSGGEFRHHENDPLPHHAVLVDEASMIDLELMERLARAVRGDARLILLGDADQLPSVEAGAVFRDLAAFAIRLTRSYRLDPGAPAGAAVLAAARAVRDGNAAALDPPRRARAAELAWGALELLEPAAAAGPGAERRLLSSFLDRWYEARIRALAGADGLAARAYLLRGDHFDDADASALASLLAHHASLRVLTVTRGAHNPTGADAVNRALARRAASATGAAGEDFPAGAPVMMTRNDYDRGLYNGDQGVAVRIVSAGVAPRLAAVFPGAGGARFAVFPLEALRHDLTLAYATTVHKAQGAELDHAALVLPERDLPLFSRELVYTALTRARRSVVVVGRWARLVEAAARPLARSTGLGARLRR